MSRRLAILAGLTAVAFALPLIGSAAAEQSSGKSSRVKGIESATKRATTVKSSKSNTSDRMGGGGGAKEGANKAINLNSSRSN